MALSLFDSSRARRWDYLPEFAEAQLPRYTSYPPANRFSPSIGPDTACAALAVLPPEASLSLYVHIPFCKKLCWYCGCHTSVPTAADPIDSYLEGLKAEIARIAQFVPKSATVTHLHFGGGSPDILAPSQIFDLFGSLRRNFKFATFTEIAAELDPRGLSSEVISEFSAQGLTRASLGVQVLEPTVQERINRVQTVREIEAAIDRLRAAGVAGVNVDMMYGLPGQTREHVIETALFAATQDVDRIAVFGYAHVPWMKKHQKGISTQDLPTGEARFRQAEAAAETLEHSGYIPIGFDHFAAPGDSLVSAALQGRLHRNFQGYSDDEASALIAFGASAISSLPGLIYQNTPDTSGYRTACTENRLPIARGVALGSDDRRIGRLIERLLCDFEIDLPEDFRQRTQTKLQHLAAAGLIELQPDRLLVTPRGKPYVRNVAACFDPGFTATSGRHSLAV
jgi:oxygen-independent coproporphyrinogen-3 oxidase